MPARVPLADKKAWPADKVERMPISTLTPYARNSRRHSDKQVDQIVASIKEFGFTVPVLVDPKGGIIAGHGRVLAAERMGLAEVPAMVAKGWTAAQKRAYVIADNKLALNADWDEDLLAEELKSLGEEGFDLALIGFEDVELVSFLADRSGGLTDPDDAPDVQTSFVSMPGDVWVCCDHRLICGDSTSPETVEKVLDGAKPHLMVTDPPYGVDYDANWRDEAAKYSPSMGNRKDTAKGKVANDDRVDWSAAWALFGGDAAYVWHSALHSAEVAASLAIDGLAIRSQIIWNKGRLVVGRGDYHWQHEPCWYVVRKGRTGHYNGDRKQTTVWDVPMPRKSETGHSTQKPVECMKRPIENNSRPGDAVYDPFLGSGTTMIAAEMTGRRCYGIELSPAYCDVIVKRWQDFTGKEATLEATGRTFAEMADERMRVAA